MTAQIARMRPMVQRDILQIVSLEKEGGSWDERVILQKATAHPGYVCVVGESLLGYMIYELRPNSIHLWNISVHPRFRRRGIGRHLMEKVIMQIDPAGRRKIEMVLREGNLQGQVFMRSMGFRCDRIVRDYFGDETSPSEMRWEDGYHFIYKAVRP